jgi:hypothetical protein
MILGMVLSNIPTVQLAAQVGHDPANSPYRDIPLKAGPMFFVGHLSNDRGRAGAGMSNALTFGTRYETPTGRSLLFQFSLAYLSGDRFIIDPRADSNSAARRTGPFKSDVLLTEIGAQLRLTGAKSWRGIVPYAGVGLGLMYDLSSPGDTTFGGQGSGYQFGTKFTLSGATGIRWFPARRLMINADLRGQLWRLRYPTSFQLPASDGSRVVPINKATDWTLHPWISLGVGWTF